MFFYISLTIVLMMRNEERILPRFLSSIEPFPLVVCDTGSTDRSLQILQKWPIFQYNWTNHYGNDRNTCMDAVMPHIRTKWVLFMDADHELRLTTRFWMSEPTYRINLIHDPHLPYLVDSALLAQCRYKGATHEFLDCPPHIPRGTYGGLRLIHHEDGIHRPEKFTKDLERLKRYWPTEKSPRNMFYIGQTYEGLGNCTQAIRWYKARIAVGGWREEIFQSYYRIARCTGLAEDYLRAYHYDPHRKEPLYWLARQNREAGNYTQCLLYSRAGLLVGNPEEEALFVDRDVYVWGIEDENALCLYYSGKGREALKHWERLLPLVPMGEYERIRNNMEY
jgi:glycosyltransferase involved in cell wall biosynthesis